MKNKQGFTLVELIAIIIIIGIVIGIIAPTALKLIEKSKANSFREGLRSIIRSAEIYIEENDLDSLPNDGIYLQNNELDIDYADGYTGVIKYVNGEVVLQNIGNGKYCGNGGKDTISVTDFSADCIVVAPDNVCFIVGTTDIAGDTITGYNYNVTGCDPTNLVIPATLDGVPVKYIADGAFIEQYNYVLYYNEFYDSYDIKENWSTLGLDYNFAMPVSINSSMLLKHCYNDNTSAYSLVNYDYEIVSGDDYLFCEIYLNSGSLDSYKSESHTITSVDFSNATNLLSIGEYAFDNNMITSVNFGNLSTLTNIGISAFAGNYISGTLDLSGLTNLSKISSDTFFKNNIDSVLLPSNIESIGIYSFEKNNLTNIIIPASVTSIGAFAFYDNLWTAVTIQSNAQNLSIRFNVAWVSIGWPIGLMVEEELIPVDYLLTAGTNIFTSTNTNYNVDVQTSGTYKLEVWGSQGGNAGGNGGYSSGNVYLSTSDNLYVYVGTQTGFNGGGGKDTVSAGGGGTDIRINSNSLYARVIVAGGGGTFGSQDSACYGGGLTGCSTEYADGGQQTVGGQGYSGEGNGDFGIGGYSANRLGSGGGGWYGGGADEVNYPGAGGSGYVYTSATAVNYPVGGLLNSSFYLTASSLLAGNVAIPTYDGVSTMIGNTGDGYAKITYVG